MKKISFSYRMQISYSQPVHDQHFTLRITPQNGSKQHVESMALRTDPECRIWHVEDSFGNLCTMGYLDLPADHFCAAADGVAVLDEDAPGAGVDPGGCLYRYPSALTKPGPALYALHEEVRHLCARQDLVTWCCCANDLVHKKVSYRKGCTDIHTDAERALEDGCGVCQDYAHIFLALCRLERIPCRYAAGIVLGIGESHAWTEVYLDGRWTGFDPTTGSWQKDSHLTLAVGRDAGDCPLNTGVFSGLAVQKQIVEARAEEI